MTRPAIYRAYERAAKDHGLSPRDMLVLLALCKYANTDGSSCLASNSTLARDLKVSRATIERAIVRLVELEYILRTRRRRTSSVTTICLEPSPVMEQGSQDPSTDEQEPSRDAREPSRVRDNRPVKTEPINNRGEIALKGNRRPSPDTGFFPDDIKRYKDHPQWDAYCDYVLALPPGQAKPIGVWLNTNHN